MKLAKALKRKNELAGDLAQLKDVLAKQNSRPSKQKPDYDTHEVLNNLRAKINELVRVKAAIASANTDVYHKIFRLAELKGLVAILTQLDTKSGIFHESAGYGESPFEVEYIAQIPKVEVDRLVRELKDDIVQLQDELDEFNFTHSVEL